MKITMIFMNEIVEIEFCRFPASIFSFPASCSSLLHLSPGGMAKEWGAHRFQPGWEHWHQSRPQPHYSTGPSVRLGELHLHGCQHCRQEEEHVCDSCGVRSVKTWLWKNLDVCAFIAAVLYIANIQLALNPRAHSFLLGWNQFCRSRLRSCLLLEWLELWGFCLWWIPRHLLAHLPQP